MSLIKRFQVHLNELGRRSRMCVSHSSKLPYNLKFKPINFFEFGRIDEIMSYKIYFMKHFCNRFKIEETSNKVNIIL